jgi:hypothetical protein
MDEKGGESGENHKDISANYINSKIITTVAIAVIVGIVFVIGLVLFGMRLVDDGRSRSTDQPVSRNNQSPAESIEIEYEKTTSAYVPADRENGATYKNALLHSVGIDDAEYMVIHDAEDLGKFITTVNSFNEFSDKKFTYEVGEDFFKSSSLIVIAKEEIALSEICINSVHRDENYNITIDATYSAENDTLGYGGEFAILKIQNIQPESVEVKWSENETAVYPDSAVGKKPIIYLYPTEITNVRVKLSNPERIIVDYPDYNNGWNVTAYPDGMLKTSSGKKLYALYYESKNIKKYNDESLKEGFVVARDDVEEFLDEKLSTLGLNYKEREEFITYWANSLEEKPYVFIRFQTRAEIDRNMGLEVTPRPDTTIRIMMEYKPLNRRVKVEEQQLQKATREGFVVVEWGGTEIK